MQHDALLPRQQPVGAVLPGAGRHVFQVVAGLALLVGERQAQAAVDQGGGIGGDLVRTALHAQQAAG